MRWPSITLVVCLMLLLAAVVGGSMLSQANRHSTIPLSQILTYEPLNPTAAETDISDIPAPIEFDLNRIQLPPDTPIIDERFKEPASK